MKKYSKNWDLSTIPADLLAAELARRRKVFAGPPIQCHSDAPDPDCPKCRQRLYRRQRRSKGMDK
jgi:hypothetical protein